MRILHVHSGNLYGGVETMLRTMARCRSEVPRHEPVFALTHDDRIACELRESGCEVHILGAVRTRRPLSILRVRQILAALCEEQHFDASIVHSAWSLALLAPAAARPIVLYQHDTFDPSNWTAVWSRRTRPDLIVANSDFTAASLGRAYGKTPVITVYPCIDPSAANDSTPRSEKRTVILQAARFESWKGHALLLDALGSLKNNPDWVLWIAGGAQRPDEAALRKQLEKRALALGIADRVTFLGHVTDMPALMRSADIYCQPNTAPEPFGLTFVEALHARMAVVATALGGVNEILHPDWGLLVAPDVNSVAHALRRLIDDRDLRAGLASEGPYRARMLCDPQKQIQKLESAIRTVTSRRAAA